MGTIRVPDSTRKKLEEIAKEKDLKKALIGVADLLENYIQTEEEIVTGYNPKDGQPSKTEWSPYQLYLPTTEIKFYYAGITLEHPNGDWRSVLRPGMPILDWSVIDIIKQKGPILLSTKDGKYTFISKPSFNGEPTNTVIISKIGIEF